MEREWIVRYKETLPSGRVYERLRIVWATSHWAAKRRLKRARLRPRQVDSARVVKV